MCHNPALVPAKLERRAARPRDLLARWRRLAPSSASAVVSLSSYASMISGASAPSSAARTLGLECGTCLPRKQLPRKARRRFQISIPLIHVLLGTQLKLGCLLPLQQQLWQYWGLAASAYTVQEDAHFLAAVLALMSRPSPDYTNTGLKATSQNLIAHSGKQDQQDRISRAREPSPSLSAAPRQYNEGSSRPNLSGHPLQLLKTLT